MKYLYLYIIYVVALFLLKLLIAYFTYKITKKKKYAFVDVFIWKYGSRKQKMA